MNKELLSNAIASLKAMRKDIRTKHLKDSIVFCSVALFGLVIGFIAGINIYRFFDNLDMHILASLVGYGAVGATLFAFGKFDFMKEIEKKMPQRKIDLCEYDFCIKKLELILSGKTIQDNEYRHIYVHLKEKYNFDLERIVTIAEATGISSTKNEGFFVMPHEIAKKINKIKNN
jgi:hypothetical protein